MISLATFCADQSADFDADTWMNPQASAVQRQTLAYAAQYLSMASWYGYQTQLARIAELLQPGIGQIGNFMRLAREIGLDLADFSIAIRFFALEKKPPPSACLLLQN
jgi:hypothetical protein